MTFTDQGAPEPYTCTRKINHQMKRTLCGNLYSYHHMLSNMFEFDLEFEMSMDLVQWNIDLLNKVSKELVGPFFHVNFLFVVPIIIHSGDHSDETSSPLHCASWYTSEHPTLSTGGKKVSFNFP